ncbi:MAG: hypothetical protein ACRD4I_03695 [Candidatus Angelobacter sp.]
MELKAASKPKYQRVLYEPANRATFTGKKFQVGGITTLWNRLLRF